MKTVLAPGDKPVRCFFYARGEQRALAVVFHRDRVVLDVRLGLGDPTRSPERVERAVDGDAVRPRSELRFAAVRRERPKDLNPHFLRDVGGEIGVADQTPYDGVDVRRVLRPKVVQRPLIAFDGALDEDLIHSHGVLLTWSHRRPGGLHAASGPISRAGRARSATRLSSRGHWTSDDSDALDPCNETAKKRLVILDHKTDRRIP